VNLVVILILKPIVGLARPTGAPNHQSVAVRACTATDLYSENCCEFGCNSAESPLSDVKYAAVTLMEREQGMSELTMAIVAYAEAMEAIQAIRQSVFQVEQGVDSDIDFDGLDEQATHIIAYWQKMPIGTARIRYLNNQTAKIERVAVLSSFRGKRIGKQIMEKAIAFLYTKAIPVIKINAQTQAKTFYEKLGFRQQGEEFEEAGIAHVEMKLEKFIPFS
jgi:predicted GNAT family N-acyltransferase